MKVQLRPHAVSSLGYGTGPFEVWEESEHFYIVFGSKRGAPLALSKSHWEPAPSVPTWRDVTAECSLLPDGQRLWHDANIPTDPKCVADLAYGYRFRKVKCDNSLDQPLWAFVIDQRVTD